MDPASFLLLAELAQAQQGVKYLVAASITFAVADFLDTFPLEVLVLWSSKWNLGKVLFLLSRYLVIVDGALSIIYNMSPNLTLSACRMVFVAGAVMTTSGVTISEAILFLRVYALSGRSPRVGGFLCLLFISIHFAVFVFLGKFIASLEYAPSPIPRMLSCLPIRAHNIMLSIVFALILASELIILGITFWIGCKKYAGSKSPIVSSFYRDGIIYFVLITAISAGNIICNLVAPPGYTYMLAIPQRVAHSILSTRMVLHLHALNKGAYEKALEVSVSTIEFLTGGRDVAETNLDPIDHSDTSRRRTSYRTPHSIV